MSEEVKRGPGRPPGSNNDPFRLWQSELVATVQLSRRVRLLTEKAVERLEKESAGIAGVGNLQKLAESGTKMMETLHRSAGMLLKQQQAEPEKEDKELDAAALLRELGGV